MPSASSSCRWRWTARSSGPCPRPGAPQRADRLGVGHVLVGAVQLVEVDAVGLKRAQRGLAGLAQMLRATVDLPRAAGPRVAALGGHDHVVAPAAQRLGDQPLVVADVVLALGVGVGGVDQLAAGVQRGVDRADRLLLRGASPQRHGHRAQPDREDVGVAEAARGCPCRGHAVALPGGRVRATRPGAGPLGSHDGRGDRRRRSGGCAVAYALARRGVAATLLEAEPALALAASGTNSGILHTGFDSTPGELETRLILRSAELRDAVLADLGVPVLRCGALLGRAARVTRRRSARWRRAPRPTASRRHCATTARSWCPARPSPTSPTLALAGAAAAGATVRVGARVTGLRRRAGRLELAIAGDRTVTCDVAVNCAGLHADDIARLAGDDGIEIAPRKGEFLVFDAPGGRLEHRAARADRAHEGRARVPHARRARRRGPDRATSRQGRLERARRGTG